jgi:cytochrome c oxidase cbb3-type subunit 3
MTLRRHRRDSAALLVVATLAMSGCGRRGVGQHEPASADSSFAAVTFQRGRSPEELSVARGRVLYDRYCAICHGETGGGDGFNAYNVKATFGVSPTEFTDSVTFRALREDTALAAIRDGGPAVGKSPAMPPWGHTLTAGEVIDVWQYIRFLSREAPQE